MSLSCTPHIPLWASSRDSSPLCPSILARPRYSILLQPTLSCFSSTQRHRLRPAIFSSAYSSGYPVSSLLHPLLFQVDHNTTAVQTTSFTRRFEVSKHPPQLLLSALSCAVSRTLPSHTFSHILASVQNTYLNPCIKVRVS